MMRVKVKPKPRNLKKTATGRTIATKAITRTTTTATTTLTKATSASPPAIYSSDLLTPDEERALLAGFWERVLPGATAE